MIPWNVSPLLGVAPRGRLYSLNVTTCGTVARLARHSFSAVLQQWVVSEHPGGLCQASDHGRPVLAASTSDT